MKRVLTPLILIIVVIATFLTGCSRQWVSIGYMPIDSGWRSEQRGAHSEFYSENLKIYVSTSNITRGSASMHGEFAVSLRIYIENDGYKFDPRQIRLFIASSGKEISPTRIEMVADAAGWGSAWQCSHGLRVWNFSGGQAYSYIAGVRTPKPDMLLELGRETCIEYYFPVQPPPTDTSFSLRVLGLNRAGRQFDVPEIFFKKDSIWVF